MLVDAVAVLSIRCNQCIIWQAAIYTYGELTNSFFWLVEFSVGVLVLQITDFQACALQIANYRFLFCKSLAHFHLVDKFTDFHFVSFCFAN